MSKYIGKFFIALIVSVILVFSLSFLFDGGEYIETWIFTFGIIIILLLSFLIAFMFYLVDLVKGKY